MKVLVTNVMKTYLFHHRYLLGKSYSLHILYFFLLFDKNSFRRKISQQNMIFGRNLLL